MSKLLNKGGYGCIYYPSLKCNGKGSNDNKHVSKLQVYNYAAKNEISIGNNLSIKDYFLYFAPIIKGCNINISNINGSLLKNVI